jgi:hypothetical protein
MDYIPKRRDEAWNPNKFSNYARPGGDEEPYDGDLYADDEYEDDYAQEIQDLDVDADELSRAGVIFEPEFNNYAPGLPEAYALNPYYDPQLRTLVPSPARQAPAGHGYQNSGSTYTPQALSVLDTKTNPVEFYETRLPLPTIGSPVRQIGRAKSFADAYQPASLVRATQAAPPAVAAHPHVLPPGTEVMDGNIAYCSLDIPSKELRQVREDLGAEMADFSRWGRGPGGGVSLDLAAPNVVSGTAIQNGPVAVSTPHVNKHLYDQGFISLSGVPMINAGTYKNPLTGVEYKAYESALPPPDADYEETLTAPARNVKLAHLQGGWTDNTPRPTKVELVEDDFHMQYDRTINTFGTYDPSRYVEMFERTNRFTRNDEHPDPDGPELVGVPANMDGNQNVKIRPLPYLPPTNRGKWGETTFRSGIDARVAVGNSQTPVERTYTSFPAARLENTRQDGGGMEVTQNTQGFMDTQMGGGGRRDVLPTQRSTTEGNLPYMAPASFVRLNANTGTAVHSAPTGDRGTQVHGEQQYGGGTHGATVHAGSSEREQLVSAPTGLSGTQYTDAQQYGGGTHGATVHAGSSAREQVVAAPTGFSGTQYLGFAQVGGGVQPSTVGGGGVADGGGSSLRNQILQSTNSMGGTTTLGDQFGSYGGEQAYGQTLSQVSVLESPTVKSGQTYARDEYGSYGGADRQAPQLVNQRVESVNSKSGVLFRRDEYGSYGGVEGEAAMSTDQRVENVNSKNGVRFRRDEYGSYGGVDGQAAKSTDQRVDHANSKSGVRLRTDAYGSGGAAGSSSFALPVAPRVYSAQDLTKRETFVGVQAAFDTTSGATTAPPTVARRSRLNSRKGPLVDFLMPSGSLSGTEGTANGSQTYGQSTSLNSKKEARYDARWGFSPQVPADPTVWYGSYNQTAERLNSRPYGNMQHLVAPASYSFFMQEIEGAV